MNNSRKVYINMESVAEHITFQLPDGRTRLQNLLDLTEECKDPKFLAQWSSVSDVACGMNTDFEAAAPFLILSDPVAKKSTRKRGSQIASVNTPGPGPKSVGHTGVELRYHNKK